MILLAKLALGMAAAGALGAGVLCSEGFIDVNVIQTQPESHHIHVIAPAMIAPLALHFVPNAKLRDPSGQLRRHMPEIQAALDGLRHAPDMTFVEVTDPRDHVRVSKRGGSIVVDVRDPGSTVASVVEQLADRDMPR